jgi:hypothetical protein
MACDGVGDGRGLDNRQREFAGPGDGLRRGGGDATVAKIVIDGGSGGVGLMVGAVLSQSLIGLRAAMSLALPACRCYQSSRD